MWDWFSAFIDDDEEFAPSSDPNVTMYVRPPARVCTYIYALCTCVGR